jgi:hypothetical protein
MYDKIITFMVELAVNLQVRLSEKDSYYLDIISKKYGYKRCQFIRDAVKEKMIRDVSKLREKFKKLNCPF